MMPNLWSNLLTALWTSLPEGDANRRSLAEVFAHPAFTGVPVSVRSAVLKLWLLAGKSRRRIPNLLSREAVTGSNITVPIIEKQALKGGKTLVPLLLDLLGIEFHPQDGRDEEPGGSALLLFAHGGAIRLDVECLECELTDLGADELGAGLGIEEEG